jgi:hypothetical protein
MIQKPIQEVIENLSLKKQMFLLAGLTLVGVCAHCRIEAPGSASEFCRRAEIDRSTQHNAASAQGLRELIGAFRVEDGA